MRAKTNKGRTNKNSHRLQDIVASTHMWLNWSCIDVFSMSS